MGLREEKKRAQRRRILDACAELFRERGLDGTTVGDILGRVGISRQTFFNYFASKEAALAELGLEWIAREARAAVLAASRSGGRGGFLPQLKRVLRRQLRAIEDDRAFMELVFTRSGLFFPHGPAPGDAHRARTRGAFELVAAGIREAQERGEIRPDADPDQAAELYVSVFYVTTRLWLTDYWGTGERLETRMLRAVDLLMDGLRHREDAARS